MGEDKKAVLKYAQKAFNQGVKVDFKPQAVFLPSGPHRGVGSPAPHPVSAGDGPYSAACFPLAFTSQLQPERV